MFVSEKELATLFDPLRHTWEAVEKWTRINCFASFRVMEEVMDGDNGRSNKQVWNPWDRINKKVIIKWWKIPGLKF